MNAAHLVSILMVLILAVCSHGKPGDTRKFVKEFIDVYSDDTKFRPAFYRMSADYAHCMDKADGITNHEFLRIMNSKFYRYIECIAQNRGTYYTPPEEAPVVGYCVVQKVQKVREELDNELSDEDKARIDSSLEEGVI